ncbi:MAG: hypothetical protein HYY84_13625 [Deltaproteobacteria bacterium]|nr:hypothetical protein [Deltaproteobacteria bacterium]
MKGTLSVIGLFIGFGLVSVAVAKGTDGPCPRARLSSDTVQRKLDEMAKVAAKTTRVVGVKPWRVSDMPVFDALNDRVGALVFVEPPALTKEEKRRIEFIELLEAIDAINIVDRLPRRASVRERSPLAAK